MHIVLALACMLGGSDLWIDPHGVVRFRYLVG